MYVNVFVQIARAPTCCSSFSLLVASWPACIAPRHMLCLQKLPWHFTKQGWMMRQTPLYTPKKRQLAQATCCCIFDSIVVMVPAWASIVASYARQQTNRMVFCV